jgi:uncharacterized delta-60 repeat protein
LQRRYRRFSEETILFKKRNTHRGYFFAVTLTAIALTAAFLHVRSAARVSASDLPDSGFQAFSVPGEAAFVDSGFNPVVSGGSAQIAESFVLPDGKILVGGDFKVINGVNRNGLARFNADGSIDAAFNSGSGPNDAVFGIAVQSTGKIIINGVFTNFNGTPVGRIARLNTDGSLDQTFNTTGVGLNGGAGAGGEVSVAKVLSDDRILIGGTFTTFNGIATNRFTRLSSNGTIDTSFNIGSGAGSSVFAIDIQSDGKAIIGGNFNSYNGTPAGKLARINTDGSIDTSFNTVPGAEQPVRSIVVQPDGKIVIAGFFTLYNNVSKNGITRLNTDGTIDPGFNVAGLDAVVLAVALQPDGDLIVGGSFTQIAGATRQCIARLNSDGTNDAGFDPGTGIGPQVIISISLQSDGKAIVVGTFSVYNGTPNGGAIRVNNAGGLDTNLAASSAVNGTINAIAIQNDGKVVIAGQFGTVNGAARNNIARLNADGTLDDSFNPGTGSGSTINSLGIQSDGKILAGGGFTSFNGTSINRIVRLNQDGSVDTGFTVGTGASSTVSAIAVQSDNRIVIGGLFTTFNGTTVNRFARLNSDGTLDTTFNTGTSASAEVRSIAFLADGRMMIGGSFTTYNGTGRNRIARINADGTLDAGFNPGTGASGVISSVALQSDGKVVAGGNFTTVNGIARNRIARFNADGTLDAGFDPGAGPGTGTGTEVTRVLPVANGKTLIAGNFTTFNGNPRNRLARLNENGSIDATFLNGIGALAPIGLSVRALVAQADGKILIGGQFSVFNVSARTGLARFSNANNTTVDFDGDGRSDFAIMRRPGVIGAWTWWITESSTGKVSTFNFGQSPRDIPQPGDFDGDGKDDVAVWRNTPLTGESNAYYIVQSSTNTIRIIPFGLPGDAPVFADYDGDGKDDLSVWRAPSAASGPGPATWFYLGSLNNPNNNITYVPWGIRYGTQSDQVDEPYPGDFDGDGRADFRIQRRADTTIATSATPAIFHTLTASGNISYEYFGLASDRIVPGDYDGDGKTDLCVARGFNTNPGNTTWYIRYTSGVPDTATVFGTGFNFAQGDYDGDGRTDIGYFIVGPTNSETGFWYLSSANSGTATFYPFGARPSGGAGSGDLPVAVYNNR